MKKSSTFWSFSKTPATLKLPKSTRRDYPKPPFGFYESFAGYAESRGFFLCRQSIAGQFDMLYGFMEESALADMAELRDRLAYDWAMMEKAEKIPEVYRARRHRTGEGILRAPSIMTRKTWKNICPDIKTFRPQAVSRMCHIALLFGSGRAVLYDYKKPKKERARYIT